VGSARTERARRFTGGPFHQALASGERIDQALAA
jgi:hypothetical protein